MPPTRTVYPRPGRCYPRNQTCVLACGGVRAVARLVDLGVLGARLRFAQAPAGLSFSRSLALDTGLTVCGAAVAGVPCRLAWKSGNEAGLEFETPLDFCLTDLQRALNVLDAA